MIVVVQKLSDYHYCDTAGEDGGMNNPTSAPSNDEHASDDDHSLLFPPSLLSPLMSPLPMYEEATTNKSHDSTLFFLNPTYHHTSLANNNHLVDSLTDINTTNASITDIHHTNNGNTNTPNNDTTSIVSPPSTSLTIKARTRKLPSCSICYTHKQRCDGQRPCSRCIRYHRSHLCTDRVVHEHMKKPQRQRRKTTATSASPSPSPAPPTATMTIQTVPTTTIVSPTTSIESIPLSISPTFEAVDAVDAAPPSSVCLSAALGPSLLGVKRTLSSSIDHDEEGLRIIKRDRSDALHVLQLLKRRMTQRDTKSVPLLVHAHGAHDNMTSDLTLLSAMEAPFGITTELKKSPSSSSPSAWFNEWMKGATKPSYRSTLTPPFNESLVVRAALLQFQPWLTAMTDHPQLLLNLTTSLVSYLRPKMPSVRVCPNWYVLSDVLSSCFVIVLNPYHLGCSVSPSKKCFKCETTPPLTIVTPTSLGEWSSAMFWSGMWTRKDSHLTPSPLFDKIGIPGLCWTHEVG
jgi:hypothetical protein